MISFLVIGRVFKICGTITKYLAMIGRRDELPDEEAVTAGVERNTSMSTTRTGPVAGKYY